MESPTVNQPVLLREHGLEFQGEYGGEYASRIESVEGTLLTLARPFDLPAENDLGEGTRLDLIWTSPTGLHELPVRVVAEDIDGPLRVWRAEPTGPARRTNRRQHLRVATGGLMTLATEEATVGALLMDASEAALRCRVEGRARELAEDTQVRTEFVIGGEAFSATGIVFRRTSLGTGTELVITLRHDERAATALRRALFAEQIRLHQMAGSQAGR
ncbi:hypothetical protein [Nocardioides sp.]|uniref:hypothetical protein n=1 Tax=Nocardioides sp. TaxID=35761 RepID=UPI002C1B77B7|nr:hypothetical protein [Nocardioides sp.]HVX55284.1 hypothetical protein [Nocardioides sp.]